MIKRRKTIRLKENYNELKSLTYGEASSPGLYETIVNNFEEKGYVCYDSLTSLGDSKVFLAVKNENHLLIGIIIMIGESWLETSKCETELNELKLMLTTISGYENAIPVIYKVLATVDEGNYENDYLNVIDRRIEII